MEIGSKVLVHAICWSGYRDVSACEDIETVYEPSSGLSHDQRCVFRCKCEPAQSGVFVGWSWLQVGVRHGGYSDSWDYEPNYLVSHKYVKVARWIPAGTRYVKPSAALPEDIELIKALEAANS